MPCDWGAPVMAGDDRLRSSETIEQPYHVTDEMEQRVLINRLGAVGPTIATHVWGHCPEPGLGKSGELMTPRVPGLGKPMAEQDERPFALLCHMHVYSVGVDEAVMNGHGDLRVGEGSGARAGLRRLRGGNRFDPSRNVRGLQQAPWLKQLADFGQGAMHDRVDEDRAEECGFKLLRFLELFWPAASRTRKGEVGAGGHAPGCLEHRGNLRHEPCLQRHDRIRFRGGPARYILQQARLLGSDRHALAVDWIEPA